MTLFDRWVRATCVRLVIGCVGGCAASHDLDATDQEPLALTDDDATDDAPSFAATYALMQTHCVSCHGAGKSLDLSTPELAREALIGVAAAYKACASDGSTPKVRVVAGDPAASLLVEKLSPAPSCGKPMPPSGPLSEAEIAVFRDWIAGGAIP